MGALATTRAAATTKTTDETSAAAGTTKEFFSSPQSNAVSQETSRFGPLLTVPRGDDSLQPPVSSMFSSVYFFIPFVNCIA